MGNAKKNRKTQRNFWWYKLGLSMICESLCHNSTFQHNPPPVLAQYLVNMG